jgi:hypothetical protein
MRSGFLLLLGATLLAGCQTVDTKQQHVAALTVSTEDLALRQAQLRRFDTMDEAKILQGCASVLQDLGFSIDEAAPSSGLIVGSKDRDAVEAQQVAGQVFFAVLISALGGKHDPVWDHNQKIRISIISRPSADRNATVVRATFQRVVWNTKGVISKAETLADPEMHRLFFDKLAQALFLEAHQI